MAGANGRKAGHICGGWNAWEKGGACLWGPARMGERWGTSVGPVHMGERWGMSVGASTRFSHKVCSVCVLRHVFLSVNDSTSQLMDSRSGA